MNFFNLPAEIADLIYDFGGQKKAWKMRFTNDVLTKIDKGHKIVGLWYNGDDDVEGMPCGNCYLYAGTECGNEEFCMNCIGNDAGKYTVMAFADYKAYFDRHEQKVSLMDAFDTYEDFERWRNVEKVRIDNYLPILSAKDFTDVLFKWELKKTIALIN
jgi:hypothetical protein